MTKLKFLAAPLILASIFLVARTALAQTPAQANAQQQAASPSMVPVTTVVTVLGPKYTAPPPLGKEDVVVHTGSHREDVLAWNAAQGERAPLQLAILIDDGAGINSQLSDLRRFIQTLPNSTSVGLFYASTGMTQTVAPFSTDHDAVAQELRITIGRSAISASIYLSTIDVMKKLAPMKGRREILLIGDGHDRLRGDLESPDVQSVIDNAQKTGIVIHTLYASVGRGRSSSIRLGYAQSNLTRVAGETGGQSFFQGLETPISFTPFLDQLDMVLHNQYFLTFATARTNKKKGGFRGFKVTTEQRNTSITAASQVFVPGP